MTQAILHPLRESMNKHNITRIAVVDDAFDPVTLSSFQEGEAQEFIDAVNEDDTLLREFHRFATGADESRVIISADLTDAVAGRLWDNREMRAASGASASNFSENGVESLRHRSRSTISHSLRAVSRPPPAKLRTAKPS